MSFNLDNIVKSNTGSFSGTSGSVSLAEGEATVAGNAVVIIVGVVGANDPVGGFVATPSGFSVLGSAPTYASKYAAVGAFLKVSASADETSWTVSVTGNAPEQVVWAVLEIEGADLDWTAVGEVLPYRRSAATGGTVAETSSPSGTTSVSETYAGVAIAAHMAVSTDTTTPEFTDYSNLFFEVATQDAALSPKAARLSVTAKQQLAVEAVGSTATHAANAYHEGIVLVFTGLDSQHAATVVNSFGAEIGTATGITSATVGDINSGPAPFDTVTGSPTIVTDHARTGSYSLRFSSTSAACNLGWVKGSAPRGNLGIAGATVPMWTDEFHIKFPSLPSVDTEIFSVQAGSAANGVKVRYVSASQKIGVKIGSGTEQLSDATVSAGQYIGVHLEYDPRTTTHVCRWAVDYNSTPGDATGPVLQTTASTGSMTAADVSAVIRGHTTAITADYNMDDILGTFKRKTFPLPNARIFPLKVDPAGSPAVVGTESNFEVYTSNGTGSAFTAAGARAALDDIPPTIGASSDGVKQVSVAANDYVTVPMETFTCAPDYHPLAGRWYWAGWAASGNPCVMRFRAADGTTEFDKIGDTVDEDWDDTNLVWGTCPHPGSFAPTAAYQLTQTKVDNLVAEFGFSTDANPDVGLHAILFELVAAVAVEYHVSELENGAFGVYVRQDPLSGAVVSYLIHTPSGSRGATLTYALAGVDQTPVYCDPDSTQEILVGAADVNTVTGTYFVADPA